MDGRGAAADTVGEPLSVQWTDSELWLGPMAALSDATQLSTTEEVPWTAMTLGAMATRLVTCVAINKSISNTVLFS